MQNRFRFSDFFRLPLIDTRLPMWFRYSKPEVNNQLIDVSARRNI